jgi:hypothetical protein
VRKQSPEYTIRINEYHEAADLHLKSLLNKQRKDLRLLICTESYQPIEGHVMGT